MFRAIVCNWKVSGSLTGTPALPGTTIGRAYARMPSTLYITSAWSVVCVERSCAESVPRGAFQDDAPKGRRGSGTGHGDGLRFRPFVLPETVQLVSERHLFYDGGPEC